MEKGVISLEMTCSLQSDWTHKSPIATKPQATGLRRLLVALDA